MTCTNKEEQKEKLNTCEEALKKCEKIKEKYEDSRQTFKALFPVPDDIEEVGIEPINNPDTYNFERRFDVEGNIDFTKKEINIKIPTNTDKLKIVHYLNISTDKVNALLIVLDGNNGNPTYPLDNSWKLETHTQFITKKFKISKTGLDETKLQEHGMLMVLVLHDDNFNGGHIAELLKQIIIAGDYDEDIYDKIVFPKMLRPDEIGGDIVP